jgi:hypothetical protein
MHSSTIQFTNGRHSPAVWVNHSEQLRAAMRTLGVPFARPTIVLVGGAAGLDAADLARLRPIFREALAPVSAALQATVIDGGTDAGVMRLMGEAHSELGLTTPLIGVAAEGTVELPGAVHEHADTAQLEPHHTHFIFVPGHNWGDESLWLARAAQVLGESATSTTVLVDGGEVAREDVKQSVTAGRGVLVIAGTGRTADDVAAAFRQRASDSENQLLVDSGLIDIFELAHGPAAVARKLRAMLARR